MKSIMKKHIKKLKTPNILACGWAMVLENNGLKIYFIRQSYQEAKYLFKNVRCDAKVFAGIYATCNQEEIRRAVEEKG